MAAELKEIIAKKYLIRCGTVLKQRHLVTEEEYQIVKSSSLNDLHQAESNPYRLQLICHGEKAQLEAYYDRLDAKYRRILSKIKRKPRATPRVPAPRVPRPARPPAVESVDATTREAVPLRASTLEAIPEEEALPDPVITLPEWDLNPSTSSLSASLPSPLPACDPYQLVEKPFPLTVPSVSSLLLEGFGDENFGSLEEDGAREFLEMATGIEQPPMSLSDPQTVQLILAQFSSFRSVSQPTDNFQDINPEEWMSPVEIGPLAENEAVPGAATVDTPAVQRQPAISLSPSTSTGGDSATGRPPAPTRRRARHVNRVRLPLVTNRAFIPPPRRVFDIFDIIIHRGIDTARLLNRTPNVNVADESVHEIPRAPLPTVDLSPIQQSNDSNVRGQRETQNADEVELHEGTQNPLMPNVERNEETHTAPSELMPQLVIDNPEPMVPIVPISSQEASDEPRSVDLPQVTMPTLPSLETPAIIVDDGAVPLPVENATGLSEATAPSMDLMLFDIFIAVQGEMCRQSFIADEGGVTVDQLKRLLNLNSRVAFVKMIKNILLLKQAGLLETHCDANLHLQSVIIRFPDEAI